MPPTFAPPSSPLEALLLWLYNSVCMMSSGQACIMT